MQIKTAMRYHRTPNEVAKIKNIDHTSVGEYMEELELSYTAEENMKWYKHFGKQFGSFFKSRTYT